MYIVVIFAETSSTLSIKRHFFNPNFRPKYFKNYNIGPSAPALQLDAFSYPIIADPSRAIATEYGMMDPDERDAAGLPLTCRAVFVIGQDKRLKLSILYPATTGNLPNCAGANVTILETFSPKNC
jgi:hypothetical protein